MANGSVADRSGGLLIDDASNVTLSSVRVMTNSITGQFVEGGGISVGGFFYNADLLLDRSVVLSNLANDGGGINFDITTTMAVRNSSIEGDVATNGAEIFNLGVLNLTNSTFYINTAARSGGGIYNSCTANVDNATFFDNIADYGADNTGDAAASSSRMGPHSSLRLTYSTVAALE